MSDAKEDAFADTGLMLRELDLVERAGITLTAILEQQLDGCK